MRGSSGLVQRATRPRPGGESAPERIVYPTWMRGTARARSERRVRIIYIRYLYEGNYLRRTEYSSTQAYSE